MSTVEGWDLHVYCDECDADDGFGGSSRAEALRQARENGWAIDLRRAAPDGSVAGGHAARCPRHSRKSAAPERLPVGARLVPLSELSGRAARRAAGEVGNG